MQAKIGSLTFIIIASIIGMIVLLIPLLAVTMPPIADLPNHLARFHILREIDINPFFQQYYSESWSSVPNLITDIIMVFGLPNIPIMLGGKILLIIYFLISILSVYVLSRVNFRKASPLFLLVFLVLYNRMMLWGMLNYVFASALAVLALGVWLKYREKHWFISITITSALSLLVYYSHLFPFCLYIGAVATFETQRFFCKDNIEWSKLLSKFVKASSQFILPLTLFFFFSPLGEGDSVINFGDFTRKLLNVPMIPFNNYNVILDSASFVIFFGLLFIGLIYRFISVAPSMWGVIGLWSIIYIFMPQYFMSSPGADLRTMLPLVFLILGSIKFSRESIRFKYALILTLIPLFFVRTTIVTKNWHWADKKVLKEYEEAISLLPEGAKIGSIFIKTTKGWFPNPPHEHYVALAVIQKSAFVPKLFAHPKQQPISFAKSYQEAALKAPSDFLYRPSGKEKLRVEPQNPNNPFYQKRFENVDYLMFSNSGPSEQSVPWFFVPKYVGDHVGLYKIDHTMRSISTVKSIHRK